VKASLNLGRVPPIFHAYCARLFVDSRKKGATEDEDAISPDDQKLGGRKPIDRETTKFELNQNQPPGKRQKRTGLTSPLEVTTADSSDASRMNPVNPKTHSMALQETPSADPPTVYASPASREKAPPNAAIEKQKTRAMAL
jgi:hypothetical protein